VGVVRSQISVSLDGYGAGPDQSVEQPLGIGGEGLHEWVIRLRSWRSAHGLEGGEEGASSAVVDEIQARVGATVMGRGMFGGGPGRWAADPAWTGWWGEEPPFRHPVFVVTHHPRMPLVQGQTTFTFVTEGVGAAVAAARAVAGDADVMIGGGPGTIDQALLAGVLEQLDLHVVPVLLGGGSRLFTEVGDASAIGLEQVRVIEAPGVTHLRYRVHRTD
jgi:dihydrofolate reductase